MNIYNIKQEYQALQELVEDIEYNQETGEIENNDEAIERLLDGIKGDTAVKVEQIEYIKNNLIGKADMIDNEVNRLKKLKQGYSANIKAITGFQIELIGLAGGKLESDLHKFGLRKSESVMLTEFVTPDMLPEEYQRTKTTVDPDKTKIKKALKEGVEIKGCELKTNYSLSVK